MSLKLVIEVKMRVGKYLVAGSVQYASLLQNL